jgi:NAD-dependent SIR2 family protein deacetylase
MTMASISDVAYFLEKGKRTRATELPVLFIGAGASIASGTKNMEDLITAVLQDYNIQLGEVNYQEKLTSFYNLMKGLDDAARWAVLKDHFDKLQPSEGYLFLAKLIKAGYFNIILSTNFDNLLEESLLQKIIFVDIFLKMLYIKKLNFKPSGFN